MSFVSSIDAKDRRILIWCLGAAICLAVTIGVLAAGSSEDENPLPSSYLVGKHGALAAYETLLKAGYTIDRWERPLSELAQSAGPETVVIFADPSIPEKEDAEAVMQILRRGGRVLATGTGGVYLVPGAYPAESKILDFAPCALEPEGLDPLANSGQAWMVPRVSWRLFNPFFRVQYTCEGQPAVVEYDWTKGHVVWWASATPLENASLSRGNDLDLLLNSIGPRQGHHIYWDESLHGDVRTTWSYASGTALTMLQIGLLSMGILIVFSFSRRSGPLRDEPEPVRTAPVEFLEALGALYKNARAASTAITVAYERFRRRALRLCGLRNQPVSAVELAAIVRRRFPHADPKLEADLVESENAATNDAIEPRAALRLIQTLHLHHQVLNAAVLAGTTGPTAKSSLSHPQEKTS